MLAVVCSLMVETKMGKRQIVVHHNGSRKKKTKRFLMVVECSHCVYAIWIQIDRIKATILSALTISILKSNDVKEVEKPEWLSFAFS